MHAMLFTLAHVPIASDDIRLCMAELVLAAEVLDLSVPLIAQYCGRARLQVHVDDRSWPSAQREIMPTILGRREG